MEPLNFNRSVRDSVHGTIRLSEEEFNIVEHELFFRLHQIRQNGLLYFVFPSATHTRFEHSLGVLHVADQTFWSLLRNSQGATEKNALANDFISAAPGQAFPFHEIGAKLLEDLHRITRISALVHDLGHGPFSHTFDAFAPKIDLIEKFIGTDRRLASISALVPLLSNKGKLRIEHEEMSCFFFTLIWEELSKKGKVKSGDSFEPEEVPGIVSAIILGKPELTTNIKLKQYILLLHDLVASAPVDVDRMDYLERDSRSIGVSYGLYDRDRLLKSFLVYKGSPKSGSGTGADSVCRLGIKYSGIRAVENFIQARFELFVQIYYHKTNSAIMLMLEKIADLAKEGVEVLPDIRTVDDLIAVYANLNDNRFLKILQNQDTEYELIGDERIKEQIQNLTNNVASRKLWKRVLEGGIEKIELVEKQLRDEMSFEDLHLEHSKPKATKDLDDGAALLKRIGKDGIYTSEKKSNWYENSLMIKALANEENNIARIYYKGENKDLLNKIRAEAREITFNNTNNEK